MASPSDRPCLRDGDRWYYLLPQQTGECEAAGAGTDGATYRLQWVRAAPNWWVSDHELELITLTALARPRTVKWVIQDAAAISERYPLTLTPAAFDERVAELGDEAPEYRLYEPVHGPGEPQVTTYEGPWLRLDGRPDADPDLPWRASLPSELKHHPEYRHLFPGSMAGFREHLIHVLKATPGVLHAFDGRVAGLSYQYRGVIEVTVEVPYDPPMGEHKAALNRDGSKSRSRPGRDQERYHHHRLDIPAPFEITASCKAAAAAAWRRRSDEAVKAVASVASAIACPCCDGVGLSIPATGFEVRPRGVRRGEPAR